MKDLEKIIPILYDKECVHCVELEDYLFDHKFTQYYLDYKLTRPVAAQILKQQFENVAINARFLTIFHTSRCRSTLLCQDLFYSGHFNIINEPRAFEPLAELTNFSPVNAMLYATAGQSKILTHKTAPYYNLFMAEHIAHFKNSINLFLYRNPRDILVSHLNDLNRIPNFKPNYDEVIQFLNNLKRTLKQATQLVKSRNLIAISFEDIGNFKALSKTVKLFNIEIDSDTFEQIKKYRSFDSHNPKLSFKESRGNDTDLHKKYHLELKLLEKLKLQNVYVEFLTVVNEVAGAEGFEPPTY